MLAGHHLVADLLAQLVGEVLGSLAVGVGQDQHELLAAVAGDGVHLARPTREDRRHPLEHLVAHGVPVGVVDALEVVDVGQDDRVFLSCALGQGVQLRQPLLERAVVGQPGQTIGRRPRLHRLVHAGVLQADADVVADDPQHLAGGRGEHTRAAGHQGDGAHHLVTADERQHQNALGVGQARLGAEHGPIGVAELSRRGHEVAILHRHRHQRARVGPTMPGQRLGQRGPVGVLGRGVHRQGLVLAVARHRTDDGHVVARDGPDRGERFLVDLLQRERFGEHLGGPVELLLLVLAALDRGEDPLVLDHATDVVGRPLQRGGFVVVERAVIDAVGTQDAAQRGAVEQRDRAQVGHRFGALVVRRQTLALERVQAHLLGVGDQRGEQPGARQHPVLDRVLALGRHLLDHQARRVAGADLAGAVLLAPDQHARAQLHRGPQQLQGVEQLLVNALDRGVGHAEFLFLARAGAALRRQRRTDQSEVTGLLAHLGQRGFDLGVVRSTKPSHQGGEHQHVACGEEAEERQVVGGQGPGAFEASVPAQRQLEPRGDQDQGHRHDAVAMHHHQERDHGVGQRIQERARAPGRREQHEDPGHQQQAQLQLGRDRALTGAARSGDLAHHRPHQGGGQQRDHRNLRQAGLPKGVAVERTRAQHRPHQGEHEHGPAPAHLPTHAVDAACQRAHGVPPACS